MKEKIKVITNSGVFEFLKDKYPFSLEGVPEGTLIQDLRIAPFYGKKIFVNEELMKQIMSIDIHSVPIYEWAKLKSGFPFPIFGESIQRDNIGRPIGRCFSEDTHNIILYHLMFTEKIDIESIEQTFSNIATFLEKYLQFGMLREDTKQFVHKTWNRDKIAIALNTFDGKADFYIMADKGNKYDTVKQFMFTCPDFLEKISETTSTYPIRKFTLEEFLLMLCEIIIKNA